MDDQEHRTMDQQRSSGMDRKAANHRGAAIAGSWVSTFRVEVQII